MHSSLRASGEGIGFHATDPYSKLGLTNVKYIIRRLSRGKMGKYTF
jgi:hypothetical protein